MSVLSMPWLYAIFSLVALFAASVLLAAREPMAVARRIRR